MGESAPIPIPRRTGPDGSYSISCLTVSLSDPLGAVPLATRSVVTALRHARSLGVTGFDLSGLSSYEWGTQMLREAFPTPDPEHVVLLGPPREGGLGRTTVGDGTGLEERMRGAIGRMREQLGGAGRWVVDWSPSARDPSPVPPPLSALGRLRSEGVIADFAVPIPSGYEPETLAHGARPSLVSGPLSLLEVATVDAVRGMSPTDRFALIARDVFAGGALDGRWLSRSPLERGPARHPETVAELHARLDPVLRLGFLTAGHRRTLPQAALAFALQWPWVLTAVVPLSTTEEWETRFGGSLGLALDPSELRRLGIGRDLEEDPGRSSAP